MSVPAWFDSQVYFENKLASLGAGWDSLALKQAFESAGYKTDAEGLYQHFVEYGNREGISPNSYFVDSEYLYNKAVDYYPAGTTITANHVESMRQALGDANLSPWQHYQKYGFAEGISPSVNFDGTAYMQAKLAQLQATEAAANWTMAKLEQAFVDQGYTALTHYYDWGVNENLNFKPGTPGTTGVTKNLGTDDESIYGSAGNDYFFAKLGALNDGDYIDGGAGTDVLEAYVGYADRALQPTINNVEKIILRAQHNNNDSGSNNPSLAAKQVDIDAGNISGMNYLQNDYSRADLTVEHVNTYSDQMTIALTNTDPGGVDYNVYFDPQHITTGNSGSTLHIHLMDVKGAQDTNGVSPLLTNPYDTLRVLYNGELINISLRDNASSDDYTGQKATYATLAKAFNDALKAVTMADGSVKDLSGQITATVGDQFTGTGSVGGLSWASNAGSTINLTSDTGSLTTNSTTGWLASGVIPTDTAYVSTANPLAGCPLLQTSIDLDNVGRIKWVDEAPECLPADAIYGSGAGDMVVGSMATTGGIERFDVVVDKGSWLSSLSSTNNALRMVKVQNGVVDGVNDKGQLFIGDSLAKAAADGNLVDWHSNLAPRNPAGNPGSWIDMPKLLTTDGLTDVKVFDASAMEGSANIGAQITAEANAKYKQDVDGLRTVYENYAPKGGDNGEFLYKFGSSADTLNMAVNGGIAADRDFGLIINGGAGDDFINFRFTDITANQLTNLRAKNLAASMNVRLEGGDGLDTIKVWGDSVITANGGAGNDAIYLGQNAADTNAVFLYNVGQTALGAVAIPNTMIYMDDLNGAQPLDNDLLSTARSFAYTATAGEKVTLTVEFLGHTSEVTLINQVAATGGGTITAEAINRAIIRAINEDAVLSKLLVAKDGSGYSLMVESLVDGLLDPNSLNVTIDDVSGNWVSATATAAYTEVMASGCVDVLDTTVTYTNGNAVVNYGLDDTALAAQTWAAGDVVELKIGDTAYYKTLSAAVTTEALLRAELVTAVDQNGVAVQDVHWITDSGASNTDGVIGIGNVDAGTAISIGRMPAAGLNVTGTDEGTTSHNIVTGGSGNDVIVLNVNSDNVFNDRVVLHSGMGNDVIYGFETDAAGTIDQFVASGLRVNNARLDSVEIDNSTRAASANNHQFTTAEIIRELVGVTAGDTGIAFLKDTTTNVFTVFTFFDGDGSGNINDASEIVDVLGTVELLGTNLANFDANDVII